MMVVNTVSLYCPDFCFVPKTVYTQLATNEESTAHAPSSRAVDTSTCRKAMRRSWRLLGLPESQLLSAALVKVICCWLRLMEDIQRPLPNGLFAPVCIGTKTKGVHGPFHFMELDLVNAHMPQARENPRVNYPVEHPHPGRWRK